MEKFQEARAKAYKNIKLADHMTYVTFKYLDDPKIMLAILENIFLGLTNAVGSLLYYERLFKRIPPFHNNFESKYNIFKEHCVEQHKIPKEYVQLLKEVKDIIIQHKKSPVEFIKNGKFVICSQEYECKTLDIEHIKDIMEKGKKFIELINTIVSEDERIFR